MTLFQQKINFSQLITGLVILFSGALVYIVDRPPEQTLFVNNGILKISLYQTLPNLFGTLGNSLPDFTHVFAFIMITAGLISCSSKGYILISTLWFITDSLFEIGQKFSTTATELIPGWFHSIPFLKNTPFFFQTGTFDWLDLAAILTGSVSAYLTIHIMAQKEKPLK
ncbi:MAG: hypothetical protein C0403_02685 [Desulfobacterium sp.]|nr:hypothetical protein [Desulfobacterium sp.]